MNQLKVTVVMLFVVLGALVFQSSAATRSVGSIQLALATTAVHAYSVTADSLLTVANARIDTNYTTPSWSLMLRAKTKLSAVIDSAAIAGLKNGLNNLETKSKPYSINATFNGNPATNMGFAWYTNQNITGGMVQVVAGTVNDTTPFSSPAFTANATSKALTGVNYNVASNGLKALTGMADSSKKNYMSNKALVTGLTANTAYSYRVGKSGAWSSIGHFTTAKATTDPYSFIYFTDPQANTDDMFAVSSKTIHAAITRLPNAKFILSCGDLVETSGTINSEWEYEQFFLTQQDIWYNYAFAPITGNHDKSASKNFTNHFNTKVTPFDSAMSTTPGSVYSFIYGDALFMALSYEDYSVAGYLDSLKSWVKTTVAANPNVKWKIAFYHKTMFTGSQSHQSDADGKAVRDAMSPLFDSLKIDIALQGHDHIYEVIGPVKNKTLVANAVSNRTTVTADVRLNVSGYLGGTYNVANGTLYFLNNSAGKKKYEPCSKAHMDSVEASLGMTNYFSLFTGRFGQNGLPTFSTVNVCTDSINFATYSVDSLGTPTLFDAFKVVKQGVGIKTSMPQSSLHNALAVHVNHAAHTVSIALNHSNETVHVSIFDCSGRNVMNKSSAALNTTLSLGSLPSGQYFLKVSAGAENMQMKFVNF